MDAGGYDNSDRGGGTADFHKRTAGGSTALLVDVEQTTRMSIDEREKDREGDASTPPRCVSSLAPFLSE